MDDWDEESKEYYQKYRANYRDPQMKQRFRKIIRQKEYRVECLDRRIRTENIVLWHITQKLAKRFMKFQKDFWQQTLSNCMP